MIEQSTKMQRILIKSFLGIIYLLLFDACWQKSGIGQISELYGFVLAGIGLVYSIEILIILLNPAREFQNRTEFILDSSLIPLLTVIVSWRNWSEIHIFLNFCWLLFALAKLSYLGYQIVSPVRSNGQALSRSICPYFYFFLWAFVAAPLHLDRIPNLNSDWSRLLLISLCAYGTYLLTTLATKHAPTGFVASVAIFFGPLGIFLRDNYYLLLGYWTLTMALHCLICLKGASLVFRVILFTTPSLAFLFYSILLQDSFQFPVAISHAVGAFLDPNCGLLYLAPILLLPFASVLDRPETENYENPRFMKYGSMLVYTTLVLSGLAMPERQRYLLICAAAPTLVFHVMVLYRRLQRTVLHLFIGYSLALGCSALLMAMNYPHVRLGLQNMIITCTRIIDGESLWLAAGCASAATVPKNTYAISWFLLAIVLLILRIAMVSRVRRLQISPYLIAPVVCCVLLSSLLYLLGGPNRFSLQVAEDIRLSKHNPIWKYKVNLDFPVNAVRFVSNLARSLHLPDETPVAEIVLRLKNEDVTTFIARAGKDTAEWAYERPDVQPNIRHNRPQIAFSWPVSLPSGIIFQAHQYDAEFNLELPVIVDELQIRFICDEDIDLNVRNITLFELKRPNLRSLTQSDRGRTLTLSRPSVQFSLPEPIMVRGVQVKSNLANAAEIKQGTVIASVQLLDSDRISLTTMVLRAGFETAEWAYDRKNLSQKLAHSRPSRYLGKRVLNAGLNSVENQYIATLPVCSGYLYSSLLITLDEEFASKPRTSLTLYDVSIF